MSFIIADGQTVDTILAIKACCQNLKMSFVIIKVILAYVTIKSLSVKDENLMCLPKARIFFMSGDFHKMTLFLQIVVGNPRRMYLEII